MKTNVINVHSQHQQNQYIKKFSQEKKTCRIFVQHKQRKKLNQLRGYQESI